MVKEVATATLSVIAKRLITYWNCLPYTKYVIGSTYSRYHPPFETIPDLKVCVKIMQTLFENEQYRKHLASRGDKQTVMLGFSMEPKTADILWPTGVQAGQRGFNSTV